MSSGLRIISLIAVLVLGVAAALLVVFRNTDLPTKRAPFTNVTYTYGNPPSSDGAGYAMNFKDADPADPVGAGIRVLTVGDVSAGPKLAGQEMTQGVSQSDSAATYFEKQFPQPVTRIGIDTTLPPEAGQNVVVAMIIADGPLPAEFSGKSPRPNVGVHLVITRQQWELGVWPTNGQLEVIAAGVFDTRRFFQPLRYEVYRDGPTVRIVQPDGKTALVSDQRIAEYSGNWGVWEIFQQGRGTPSPLIRSWWAQ
ncbi:hypothetical protein Mycsm_01360 [Mycobacterium sp. JS623]|uniref:hypothetical protein n=1 Tax=Mycobacterium sp. JS623 TaxID=212767 RepID=UPI0002A58F4C|nr:hypothetical protein [Mycobacterium sp. JS623]AGB21772.1 hypothetical protein Mycsm_01360 [Mycobacterium sp. JS623]